jgi:hypothetical protein
VRKEQLRFPVTLTGWETESSGQFDCAVRRQCVVGSEEYYAVEGEMTAVNLQTCWKKEMGLQFEMSI